MRDRERPNRGVGDIADVLYDAGEFGVFDRVILKRIERPKETVVFV